MRTNAKNDGRDFQVEIENSLIRVSEFIRLRKVDPPVKILGGGKFRKVIFLPNPFLDYVGCWRERGGRAVFMEAKATSKDQLAFNSSGGITENQMDSMKQWTAAGGIAFVLWRCPSGVALITYALLRICEIQNQSREAHKHIKWDNVADGHKVQTIPRPGGYVHDFLTTMRRIWIN